jgi:hypothetical protein
VPLQLLLGKWPDEDVVLTGVEMDVFVAMSQRAWLSSMYTERTERVEPTGESDHGTLAIFIFYHQALWSDR